VTLRGEVARLDDIDAFEAHARGIAGVDDVNNLLRLPVAVARSAAPPPASTA
jgi:osmotically-inducible protein OsmY